MFFARVQLGNPGNYVDSNRKMPKLIQGYDVHGKRYDSVNSPGMMAIVYDNYKAYPMYYVNFT